MRFDFGIAASRCCALIVGIETYAYGTTLHGPAADALRFASWLRRRGVHPRNMRLFLSIAHDVDPPAVPELSLKAVGAGREVVFDDGLKIVIEAPTQDELYLALTSKWCPDAEAFFLFWGGHGTLEDTSNDRHLYVQDTLAYYEKTIDIGKHLAYLRSTKFNGWRRQVAFIDACATLLSQRQRKLRPAQLDDYVLNPKIRQLVLHAASPGERAQNVADEATGLFSKVILSLLADTARLPPDASGWPDFERLAELVEDELAGRPQTPIVFIQDELGRDHRVNAARLVQPQVQPLLDLMQELPAVDLGLLQRTFRLVLADVPSAPATPNTTRELLQSLAAFTPAESGLSLLERFFAQLYCRLKADAHAQDAARLDNWLRRNVVDQPALRQLIQRESEPAPPHVHLLIDVPALDRPQAVRAWLFQSGLEPKPWLEEVTAESLERTLGLALAWAGEQCRSAQIVVELLVPRPLLASDLDRKEVLLPSGVPGEEAVGRILGVDFPTYFRLRERLVYRSAIIARDWQREASSLFARLQGGGPYGVLWIDCGGCRHIAPDAERPWLGCLSVVGAARVAKLPFDEALSRGAPLLCWPRETLQDPVVFREAIERVVKPTVLQRLPAALREACSTGCAQAKWLIDSPERQLPETFADPGQR